MLVRQLTACAAAMLPSISMAQQWQVVVLHPAGARSSTVNGVTPGAQFGTSDFAANGLQAGLWQGTAASWAPLTGPSTFSEGLGLDARHQVGDFGNHATLWTGTAPSAIDLHPAPTGATSSAATALVGGLQVGVIGFGNGIRHACT